MATPRSVIIGSDVIGMKTVQEEKQILEELAISYKRLTVILHQAKWSVFCPESYAMLEKISTRYTQVGFVKVDVDEIRTVDHITTPVVMLYIGDVMVDILQETDIINLEKTLVKWLRIGDPAYRHHYTSELLVQNTASAKLDELMEVMNSTDIANAFEKNANFLRHIVQVICLSIRTEGDNSLQLFKFILNLLTFFASSPDHALSEELNSWLMKLLETTASRLEVRRKCALLLAMSIYKRISMTDYCKDRFPFLMYLTEPYTLLQLPMKDVQFVLLTALTLRVTSPSTNALKEFLASSRPVIVHFPVKIQALFSLCSSSLFDTEHGFALTVLNEII
ncbi:hypothetical protein D918_05068 [Trichuris suis]|nr:hypothetical protein D918_05068 [Trichuris suis]